jgi:hypothetical protein
MPVAHSDDEEAKLLEHLEGAMNSARKLKLRDMELILRMAVLELANYHKNNGSADPGSIEKSDIK